MSISSVFFRSVVEAVQFCADLVRRGVVFRMVPVGDGFSVELAGI